MHCNLKSIPTLSNFHSLAPQGCFFFILIISPTLNSIFPLLSLFSINFPIKFTIAENIFYVKVFSFILSSFFLSCPVFLLSHLLFYPSRYFLLLSSVLLLSHPQLSFAIFFVPFPVCLYHLFFLPFYNYFIPYFFFF